MHSREILRGSHCPLQTLVVKLIGGGTRRPAGKIRADRNDGVFFLDILMNGVVGETGQGEAGTGENGFDLVGGREAANAVEEVGGLFFGQHQRIFPFSLGTEAEHAASSLIFNGKAAPPNDSSPLRRLQKSRPTCLPFDSL